MGARSSPFDLSDDRAAKCRKKKNSEDQGQIQATEPPTTPSQEPGAQGSDAKQGHPGFAPQAAGVSTQNAGGGVHPAPRQQGVTQSWLVVQVWVPQAIPAGASRPPPASPPSAPPASPMPAAPPAPPTPPVPRCPPAPPDPGLLAPHALTITTKQNRQRRTTRFDFGMDDELFFPSGQ